MRFNSLYTDFSVPTLLTTVSDKIMSEKSVYDTT